jgi:uncharacterized protein (TIGR00290 family)
MEGSYDGAMRPKAVMSWSSGKDSAFALHEARLSGEVEIVGLLTTVTSAFGRVSMHGVREGLLDRQAEALGLECWKVPIPSPCPNEVYEREMGRVLAEVGRLGVDRVIFGDLFLEDLRRYRETKLREIGMSAVFPLWMRDTTLLARQMIASGLEATITCIDPRKLDRSFAGRSFDAALLEAMPRDIDPCGENGEFHTFASAGPMFTGPIDIAVGEVVERDGFVFADLVPTEGPPTKQSASMPDQRSQDQSIGPRPVASLCERCDFCRKVRGRQSTFLMCTALSEKYPRQPVLECAAFRAASEASRD